MSHKLFSFPAGLVLGLFCLSATASAQVLAPSLRQDAMQDMQDQWRSGLSSNTAKHSATDGNAIPPAQQLPASMEDIPPFGSNLFLGDVTARRAEIVQPDYKIVPGDRVAVRMYGATSMDGTFNVDNQGNIFLPDIGPVALQGVQQDDLNSVINQHASNVYRENVQTYSTLLGSLPISVFVAGEVYAPGRYTGVSTDSIIDFLDMARGINPGQGSYRVIKIIRGNQEVYTMDIYDFLRQGHMPQQRMREGDTILVTAKNSAVKVKDGVVRPYAYEFLPRQPILGAELVEMANPLPQATHVSVEGTREEKPYQAYLSMEEFASLPLSDGDSVSFIQGVHREQTGIRISGMHEGARRMVVPQNAKLKEVLNNIKINPELADLNAIYVRRESVARKQKAAIIDSLQRLEQTMLLARASGISETQALTASEASILQGFMERAEALEPEGRVVVSRDGEINDIRLEDGDEIVIPEKTDVVAINGEVLMPQAIVWESGESVMDYIEKAGGFSDRANESQIVVVRANGGTEIGRGVDIQPGDEILILPEVKMSNLQIASGVMDIIYKAAVAAAIPFRL